MKNLLPLAAVGALITVAGYVHGVWTDRWSVSDELASAVAHLERVPTTIGDWRARELEMDPLEQQRSGTAAYLLRRYENTKTGAAVVVLLACGRSGPMAVHTPDLCYSGAGFAVSDPDRYADPAQKGGPAAEFWTARFSKAAGAALTRLRLYWCWRGQGDWEAPAQPRVRFAGQPALYKLYVIQELTRSDETLDEEMGKDFLRRLMPELDRALAP